jgi:hypothetical protein
LKKGDLQTLVGFVIHQDENSVKTVKMVNENGVSSEWHFRATGPNASSWFEIAYIHLVRCGTSA